MLAAAVGTLALAAATGFPASAALPILITRASYEGLVGYRDACGGRVNTWQVATASRYACGTRIRIQYGRRWVIAVTRDHGPYVPGRSLDIWTATARRLGFASGAAFGVRTVTMQLVAR